MLHLPPRELLLYGLVENRGIVLVAVAFGFLWELGVADRLLGRFWEDSDSVRGTVQELTRAASGLGGPLPARIALAAGALLALLLLVRLLSMAWALLRLHGFRLLRVGEDLRSEFGLLTRVTATVPRHRIQTLTVREGPLQRLLGRVSVAVETAGGHGEQESAGRRESLAPILRREALAGFLCQVLPELPESVQRLGWAGVSWRPVDPGAFRRVIKHWVLVALVPCIPLAVFLRWWVFLPLALLLAWAAWMARKEVGHLGWALTDGAVLFRSGWLWRRITVARFAKIQAVALHESPFDRRRAMARVRVDTAGAATLGHRVDIPYLPRETARQLSDLLAGQAARNAFEW